MSIMFLKIFEKVLLSFENSRSVLDYWVDITELREIDKVSIVLTGKLDFLIVDYFCFINFQAIIQ